MSDMSDYLGRANRVLGEVLGEGREKANAKLKALIASFDTWDEYGPALVEAAARVNAYTRLIGKDGPI